MGDRKEERYRFGDFTKGAARRVRGRLSRGDGGSEDGAQGERAADLPTAAAAVPESTSGSDPAPAPAAAAAPDVGAPSTSGSDVPVRAPGEAGSGSTSSALQSAVAGAADGGEGAVGGGTPAADAQLPADAAEQRQEGYRFGDFSRAAARRVRDRIGRGGSEDGSRASGDDAGSDDGGLHQQVSSVTAKLASRVTGGAAPERAASAGPSEDGFRKQISGVTASLAARVRGSSVDGTSEDAASDDGTVGFRRRLAARLGRVSEDGSTDGGDKDGFRDRVGAFASRFSTAVSGAGEQRGGIAWLLQAATERLDAVQGHAQSTVERAKVRASLAVGQVVRDKLPPRLLSLRDSILADQVELGMPMFVHDFLRRAIDYWWEDACGELVDLVASIVEHSVVQQPPPLIQTDAPGPCCRCCIGAWRYYLLPFDQSLWRRWRSCSRVCHTLFYWLPIWSVPQLFLSVRIFLIDRKDEYQLFRLVTGLKIAQFIGYTIINGISSVARMYICAVGLQTSPAGSVGGNDSWPSCQSIGPAIPIFLFVLLIPQILVCWTALLLLRSAESKGDTRPPGAPRWRVWDTAGRWVLCYDVVATLVCGAIIAVAVLTQADWYHSDDWDPRRSDNWYSSKHWQFLCTLDAVNMVYGLLALPICLLRLPVISTLLTHARHTGYTRSGACVPWVGLKAYRQADGTVVPADRGPPLGRSEPPQWTGSDGEAEETDETPLLGGAAKRAREARAAVTEAALKAASVDAGKAARSARDAILESVDKLRAKGAAAADEIAHREEWAARLERKVEVEVIPKALDAAAEKLIFPTIRDPYMPRWAQEWLASMWDSVWGSLKVFIAGETYMALREPPPPEDLHASRCVAWMRYQLYPYDKSIWQKLRSCMFVLWILGKMVPLFGVAQLVKFVEFGLIDRTDEHMLVEYIVDFKGVQFLTVGVLQTLVIVVGLYRCSVAEPPDCDTLSWHGVFGVNAAVGLAAFLLQVAFCWAAFWCLGTARAKGNVVDGDIAAGTRHTVENRRRRLWRFLVYDMCVFVVCLSVGLLTAFFHSNKRARLFGDDAVELEDNWRFIVTMLLLRAVYGLSSLPFIVFLVPPFRFTFTHAKPTGYDRQGNTRREDVTPPSKRRPAKEARKSPQLQPVATAAAPEWRHQPQWSDQPAVQ